MPLFKIKEYINLAIEGENAYSKRLEMMLEQEKIVKTKIAELQEQLKYINYKKIFIKTNNDFACIKVRLMNYD